MKNLAIVIPTLNVGGAELAAVRFANSLASAELNVTLLVLLGSESPQVRLSAFVKLEHLKCTNMRSSIFRLGSFLRRSPHSVIFSMLRGSNYVVSISSLLFRYDGALVFREANVLFSSTQRLIIRVLTTLMLAIFYRRASVLVANCQITCDQLMKILPSVPVRLVHNPVIDDFILEFRKDLRNNSQRRLKIALVARHVPQKRIELALLAFREILKEEPNAELTIVGDGPLYSFHQGIAPRGVIFKRRLSSEKVFLLLQSSLFFLTTSKHEGTPNSLIEAFAIGLTVFSTRFEGGFEELEARGVVRPVESDANSIAAAILQEYRSHLQGKRFSNLSAVSSWHVDAVRRDFRSRVLGPCLM